MSPLVGACTTADTTPQKVIERLFALTDSNDPAAIADCFAAPWLAQFDAEALGRWATAGPMTSLQIQAIDTVGTKTRFRVAVTLAHGERIDWPANATRFFTIASDAGAQRIAEVATALAAP